MSGDYWQDRIGESNDYLDRRYDQRNFDDDLAARSSEVWAGIKGHDHSRGRWALGLPPPDPAPEDADRLEPMTRRESYETTECPKHVFVETLGELVDNEEAAPPQVKLDPDAPDEDGDVLVRHRGPTHCRTLRSAGCGPESGRRCAVPARTRKVLGSSLPAGARAAWQESPSSGLAT
ncbi:MAG TPA: hypothetical protein VIU11_02545 [Nakamurella sp.]